MAADNERSLHWTLYLDSERIRRFVPRNLLISARETVTENAVSTVGNWLYTWRLLAGRVVWTRLARVNLGMRGPIGPDFLLGLFQYYDRDPFLYGVSTDGGTTFLRHARLVSLRDLYLGISQVNQVGDANLTQPDPISQAYRTLTYSVPGEEGVPRFFWWSLSDHLGPTLATKPDFVREINGADGTLIRQLTPAELPDLPEGVNAASNTRLFRVRDRDYLLIGVANGFNVYPVSYDADGLLTFGDRVSFTVPAGLQTPDLNSRKLLGVFERPRDYFDQDPSDRMLILFVDGHIEITFSDFLEGGAFLRDEDVVNAMGDVPETVSGNNVRQSPMAILREPKALPESANRWWSGEGDLLFEGHRWRGATYPDGGSLLGISGVKYTQNLPGRRTTASLAVTAESARALLNVDLGAVEAEIGWILRENPWADYTRIPRYFRGRVGLTNIQDGVFRAEIETYLGDVDRGVPFYWSHETADRGDFYAWKARAIEQGAVSGDSQWPPFT